MAQLKDPYLAYIITYMICYMLPYVCEAIMLYATNTCVKVTCHYTGLAPPLRFRLTSSPAVCVYLQRREKEYVDYQQERMAQAKSNFRDLLKETKLITYK